MWIWWIISLIVLIACIIFAYKMIISSNEFMPAEKRTFLGLKKNTASSSKSGSEPFYELKSHLKKMEENASLYQIQFSKLHERLKALEAENEKRQVTVAAQKIDPEEDWKEMYYEENEAKEKLENELDVTLQKLEEAENSLAALQENKTGFARLQSHYDARVDELASKQEQIALLQKQLEAAVDREKELQLTLLSEINSKKQLENIDRENARLKSENDTLRSQVVELDKKEKELRLRVARSNELESELSICQEEKSKMIAKLEKIMKDKFFSTAKDS